VSDATETYRVLGIGLGIGEPESALVERALAAAGLGPGELRGFRISRKSLDARRSGGSRRLRFVVHVDLVITKGHRSPAFDRALRAGRVVRAPASGSLVVSNRHETVSVARVAVVGSGPAGLFAALALALSGAEVDLFERGPSLRERGRALARFDRTRVPDPERNLLFGEGGAGTYSDGKLYTRVDDPLEIPILEALVACGAPTEILYDARAHIGTDRLHRILPRLRERLEAEGVRLHFGVRVDGWTVRGETPARVVSLRTPAGEAPCDAVVLAPGHSARDTWRALARDGLVVEPKPFQLGVRVEHPQPLVDVDRHGTGPEAALLGPASYSLLCRSDGGTPATYSFCMCPGGQIVASVSRPEFLCTNGMSNSRHSSPFANAAIVTTLGPREFGTGAFDGVALQERIEQAAFEAGGSDYTAPAQRVPDFLAAREGVGPLRTSYRFGVRPGRVDRLLPDLVRSALVRALVRFDHSIPGFAGPEAVMVGVETRSSGPVRLPRDRETFRAAGFANVFPCGEGAGWAGGIMSAAIDGARAAQALLRFGIGGASPTSPERTRVRRAD
jgi:uncharacterized FAD-dependent dehydrogenase